MARMPWRRTLHLLLQQQQRSLLPALAATSRSSSAASFSEELCSKTAPWILSTREAHFSPRDHLSGGCTPVCGSRIGAEWGMANGRRSFHATGIQRMSRQNFYETLGLQKGANAKEIKSAYYQLAKKWHLDVNKGNADAEKKFQEIQQAYEVLKDDEKRAMYDQVKHEAFKQAAGGAPDGGPGGFGGFHETILGRSNEILRRFARPEILLTLYILWRTGSSSLSFGVLVHTSACSRGPIFEPVRLSVHPRTKC